ncbi:MAG: hypothetical protein LBS21_15670 [Clostridiales bacterium]|jgi:hypothetical protein|nr:hypothetical protein [Clostridiales bacterium]
MKENKKKNISFKAKLTILLILSPLIFTLYMTYINIHFVKASCIRQLEQQIKENMNNDIAEDDFRWHVKEHNINSTKGQTLLLAIIKDFKPNYKFYTVGVRQAGKINAGNIKLMYFTDTDPQYMEFNLLGNKGINYYTLDSTNEALQAYFKYVETLDSR